MDRTGLVASAILGGALLLCLGMLIGAMVQAHDSRSPDALERIDANAGHNYSMLCDMQDQLDALEDAAQGPPPPGEPIITREPDASWRIPIVVNGNAFGLCADGSGTCLYVIGGYDTPQCRVFIATKGKTYWLDLDEQSVHALAAMLRRGGLNVEEGSNIAEAELRVHGPGVAIDGPPALPREPALTTDDILEKEFADDE